MKIKINAIDQITIEDFADRKGFEMVVNERPKPEGDPSRYSAHFDGVEVMDRGCLGGEYGNGATPEEAIQDYAKRISLKRIAHGAYTENRREFDVPRLILSNGKDHRP